MVLIRYFGAAQAAAGTAQEELTAGRDSVRAVLEAALAAHPDPGTGPALSQVLQRSSLLLDETAVRDLDQSLGDAKMLDVLPPFAGG